MNTDNTSPTDGGVASPMGGAPASTPAMGDMQPVADSPVANVPGMPAAPATMTPEPVVGGTSPAAPATPVEGAVEPTEDGGNSGTGGTPPTV